MLSRATIWITSDLLIEFISILFLNILKVSSSIIKLLKVSSNNLIASSCLDVVKSILKQNKSLSKVTSNSTFGE